MKKELARIWSVCTDQIYDKNKYVRNLDELLRSESVRNIFDAACGTGFPALELFELGYNLTCSDGSEEMLEQFNLRSKGRLNAKKLDWRELAEHYGQEFDAVLVRGNSLIYANSWNQKKINSQKARFIIFESLRNFYRVLKKSGFLYVDLYNENEQPHKLDLGNIVFNGNSERWIWGIEHDWNNRIRTWYIERIDLATAKEVKHNSYSYLIKHEELIELLKKTSFQSIEKRIIEGETNYTVYIARK